MYGWALIRTMISSVKCILYTYRRNIMLLINVSCLLVLYILLFGVQWMEKRELMLWGHGSITYRYGMIDSWTDRLMKIYFPQARAPDSPVVIVGTHCDMIKGETEKERRKKELRDYIEVK